MVNQAYYQLVGHREIEGRPVFEALPEGRNQGFEELLQGVYRTGKPFAGRALPLRVQKEPGGSGLGGPRDRAQRGRPGDRAGAQPGLVELHGGSIAVRSAGAGLGSEFIVSLPRVAAQDAPRCVLVADDNRDGLESLAALLSMHGHQVHVATDGNEALARAEHVRPDVVLLDIGMPGLTGYEVAARIRASDWGGKMLLIALTGWGQAQDQARAHAAGFDHHITKPLDLETLLALLAQTHADA